MTQLEYLIALVSIIVGLALADLAGSFRELVRPRRAVRWHWLPLAWAAIILLIVVQFWWLSFDALQQAVFGRALAFLPYLIAFLVLYLACAFALPDPECRPECAPEKNWGPVPSGVPSKALNMEAFYFSPVHRRWFFGALIVLIVIGQITSLGPSVVFGRATGSDVALTASANFSTAGLLGVLILTDRRWVHGSVTVLVLAAIGYTFLLGLPALG